MSEVQEIKNKSQKKVPKRDSFVDMSKFFKFKEWNSEDKAVYPLIYFIIILLVMAVINIILFGMGSDFTNQTFFGHTVNGNAGAVIEGSAGSANGAVADVTKSSAWYALGWILLFASLVASVFQFISNIFVTKFSKKFIWFNQISMFLLLIIDIIYGIWWIALTQVAGLILAQIRYFEWDKKDAKEEQGVDPYASELDYQFLGITILALAIFFVVGMLLLTDTAFSKDHTFYEFTDDGAGVVSIKTGGVIWDSSPWIDLAGGVFQIAGLILMIRKTWLCWLMWEFAEICMITVFIKSGNVIMIVQNILLFLSNLLPLFYWVVQNKKSAQRIKAGKPYVAPVE
ncbi:MAG: hypothetical protein TYPL_3850 [Candidatus Tyloplasma litorale]|nr:MAG: hypothetical protein TYPL_3850 [Mycoplasmatales bacterium]